MSDSLNNVGLRSGVVIILPEIENIAVNNQSKNNPEFYKWKTGEWSESA